jgi:hypothetical protein
VQRPSRRTRSGVSSAASDAAHGGGTTVRDGYPVYGTGSGAWARTRQPVRGGQLQAAPRLGGCRGLGPQWWGDARGGALPHHFRKPERSSVALVEVRCRGHPEERALALAVRHRTPRMAKKKKKKQKSGVASPLSLLPAPNPGSSRCATLHLPVTRSSFNTNCNPAALPRAVPCTCAAACLC